MATASILRLVQVLLSLSLVSIATAQGRLARGPLLPRLPRALSFPWTQRDTSSETSGNGRDPLNQLYGFLGMSQGAFNPVDPNPATPKAVSSNAVDSKSLSQKGADSKPPNGNSRPASSTADRWSSGAEAESLPIPDAAERGESEGLRRELRERTAGRGTRGRRGGRSGRRPNNSDSDSNRRRRRSFDPIATIDPFSSSSLAEAYAPAPFSLELSPTPKASSPAPDTSSAPVFGTSAASPSGPAPAISFDGGTSAAPSPSADAVEAPAAGAAVGGPAPAPAPSILLNPNSLEKFVDPLPIPPVLNGSIPGRVLTIGMYKTQQRFHRDLPTSTVYAYGTSKETASSPGPTIEALRGFNTQIQWRNYLEDTQHIFPQDPTIAQAQPPQGGIPTVVHRHGGEHAPQYDGHPDSWFTFRGDTGPTFSTNFYNYTNSQYPTMMWYHDHTVGWTRLNVAAGLYGMFFLREPYGKESTLHLPSGKYEIPLALDDKKFYANGSQWYATQGVDPAHPVWVPDYIGDTILVNGKVWPVLEAERTAYRFRILDASNSREFNLSFVCAASSDYPNFYLPLKGYNVPIYQIGTMGGFLNKPVSLDSLFLGVAERYDIILDFASLDPDTCQDIIVTSNLPDTYPIGIPADNNTGIVMKIHLNGEPSPPFVFPTMPQIVQPLSADNNMLFRYIDMSIVANRTTRQPISLFMAGYSYEDPPTEKPFYGSQEIWNFINPLRVLHPIHLHLVEFQVMYRRPINVSLYNSGECSLRNASRPSCYTGPTQPPLPNEGGWVDMVKALPRFVTTIIVRFADQSGEPFPFDPTEAPHYVWHCHISEHEDNDMMRPLIVMPQPLAELNNRNDSRVTELPRLRSTFP